MSDWRPDLSGFSVTKEWFPRDWGNLLDWPPLEGRPVIADSSARVLAAQNGIIYARQCPDLFPDIDALVARFRYATSEELFALVSKDPSIVWLSVARHSPAGTLPATILDHPGIGSSARRRVLLVFQCGVRGHIALRERRQTLHRCLLRWPHHRASAGV